MNKFLAESQATGLIDLVLAGENPDELIEKAVAHIDEGYGGGPFPIGSTVKINQKWASETPEGEAISLARGDVVSVLDPFLGENGTDVMVLLSDGKTRTIIPYEVMGESVIEQDDLMKAPTGHTVPSATGTSMTGKSKMVGDADPPKDLPQPKGSKQATSLAGKPQGSGLPKDDPAAQMAGSEVPVTISGQLVEDVLNKLEELAGLTTDAEEKECLEAISTYLIDAENEELFTQAHVMLFGEGVFSLADLASTILEHDGGEETSADDLVEKKKGGLPPWMKKDTDDDADDDDDDDDDTDDDDDEDGDDDTESGEDSKKKKK